MKALSLLIKPASSSCNLRCRYCFYADLSDNRSVKNYGVMRPECAQTLIQKALETNAEHISFAFQGGEPLIAGLSFYESFVGLVNKHNVNKLEIAYSIQTNGVLIDSAWADFFHRNKFLTGLSLDGYQELHDYNRPGSYNRVLRAAKLLKEHGAEFNILTVVTDITAKHIVKIYNHFKKQGFCYLQFIPCLESLNCGSGEKPFLSEEKYGEFLKTLFDLWYSDYKKGEYISIRHIDNYVNILTGRPPECCAMGGRCGVYFVVEADGSLYPCDFYSIDKYKLKTAFDPDPFTLNEAHKSFLSESENLTAECRACQYYPLCRGGCRRDREPGLTANKHCPAFKAFFNHAITRLKEVSAGLR